MCIDFQRGNSSPWPWGEPRTRGSMWLGAIVKDDGTSTNVAECRQSLVQLDFHVPHPARDRTKWHTRSVLPTWRHSLLPCVLHNFRTLKHPTYTATWCISNWCTNVLVYMYYLILLLTWNFCITKFMRCYGTQHCLSPTHPLMTGCSLTYGFKFDDEITYLKQISVGAQCAVALSPMSSIIMWHQKIAKIGSCQNIFLFLPSWTPWWNREYQPSPSYCASRARRHSSMLNIKLAILVPK